MSGGWRRSATLMRWPLTSTRWWPIPAAVARWAYGVARGCLAATRSIVSSTTSTRSIAPSRRNGLQSLAMPVRRSLALIVFVAALHGLFFIWYQQPDWTTQWTDQDGYKRLGQVLASTGRFTRYPDAPQFVPEV